VYLTVQQRKRGVLFTTLTLLTLNMTPLAQVHHVPSIAALYTYSTVATSRRMAGVKMSFKTLYMYLI
jgi:hypothetical protein